MYDVLGESVSFSTLAPIVLAVGGALNTPTVEIWSDEDERAYFRDGGT